MSRSAIVISPNPTSDSGGTERFCRQIASLLEKHDFDVTLAGPSPAPAAVARQGGASLWQARSVHHLMDDADLLVTTGIWGWPGRYRGPRVHVFVGNAVRLAPLQPARWHWRVRWGLAGWLAETLAARRAIVVAGSDQAAEDAARFYRARVEAVLPLGVDTGLFRPRNREEARRRLGLRDDGRYALFVGRAEAGKGADVALGASGAAGFELLGAGAGPLSGSIPLGVLSQEELAWAYAAADAVVLPTRYEGFGYVAVEGVACGVPVVTTPTGWARELARDVPEYRPLLVPPHTDAVAGALACIGSDVVRDAIEAGRRYVLERNTLAAFERRWTEFFAQLGAFA